MFSPGESHGQRSLVGCSPWGRKEWDRIEWLTLVCEFWGNNIQSRVLTKQDTFTWLLFLGVGGGRFYFSQFGMDISYRNRLGCKSEKTRRTFFFPLILPLCMWQRVWRQMAQEGTVVPSASWEPLLLGLQLCHPWNMDFDLELASSRTQGDDFSATLGPRSTQAGGSFDWALPPVLSRAFCLGLVVWKQLMCQG